MKVFRWDLVTAMNKETYYWLSERNDNRGVVLGAIVSKGELFSPVVLNRFRSGWSTINELLSLKDAKEAIEKKLFDDGIIQEGETIEDYTLP